MADKLLLEDVRFYGQHGLTKAEQTVGAWFSVDAELALDLGPAALSDDLGAAVDYGAVARRIVEIGTGQRVNLIERLADRKSTRLNSSHLGSSYAVFCLKKKNLRVCDSRGRHHPRGQRRRHALP